MFEYKMDTLRIWKKTKASRWTTGRPLLRGISVRINGTVYTESTKEFREAFDKEKIWETLNDRI